MKSGGLFFCALLLLISGESWAFCVCESNAVARAITRHMNQDSRNYTRTNGVLLQYLPPINDGIAKMYSSHEQQMAHESGMNDKLIHEMQQALQEQAAARNDGEAARAIIGGVHPNACGQAQQARGTGVGLVTVASTGREMRKAARASVNRVRNPRSQITMVNALPDRQLVAEMTMTDSGTLSGSQYVDAMKYREVIMPEPPTAPEALPASVKTSPQGRQYEETFKRYAAQMDLYNKMFMRDTAMSVRAIEVANTPGQPSVEQIWRDITSGIALPDSTKATSGNGASALPDHWGGIVPETVNGRRYVSEKDIIRTEVFKRYANPKYQDSTTYGLASFATPEAHMKEIIAQAAVANRMLYEIMNARLHKKQADGLRGLWKTDQDFKPMLNQIAADGAR